MAESNKEKDCKKELQLREQGKIYLLFNKIADRYDITNRFLSFGQDSKWRNELIRHIQIPENTQTFYILDLATGTGEILKAYRRQYPDNGFIIGIDLAENMLRGAQEKFCQEKNKLWLFSIMDATQLGISTNSVDVVTIAFGIRNVSEIQTALQEIYRVLKPGGQLLILEFGLPQKGLWRKIYLFYLRHILPCLGGLWTNCSPAYQYLSQTICDFPSHNHFLQILNKEGFIQTQWIEFNRGAVLLYLAQKAKS
ncbi:MAG TPA: bifunctional demethylmenaquinone methyltransferase/2-methoxy-6-polyprenyl-1,4-benzoquinol methylase UbiE [Candidatus Hydrogenedens sp.]|nr:bifunctional demethylmenaquinone methyltransferase/2-methoxy-6-polyprenyl-1,4-benzoquinol methylase UbiE [Candidatus Hydrogenedens sp.]HOK09498.1 bifunctional demethylmenaquinone methyltransferase/2-methoxy-6-polyprenyl-1,4-benzoquinol methylase UbiE [Candidatus Hydrogenedens sp.]HOL20209.1 bifunctional demethylmenaquinone methyltransferase/2-methoxy-6-polyprenyl-1,4-benzoquinol methylase UbiE [Candidatus Hydrogenedens sp.]HPP59207.1 bifunctional demethylmenaquinone methyltransferase/2-methox